jgi:hypothetical protein
MSDLIPYFAALLITVLFGMILLALQSPKKDKGG